ncbi:MAG TPA: AraC family transcriptional regulator [Abditibacteriaceae bacterium]|jgi:AraC-like DNA-binding protein
MYISERLPSADPSSDWHVRIFAVRRRLLSAGEWKARDVCSPFWRLYVNDRDGMVVHLPDNRHDGTQVELRSGCAYFIPAGTRFTGHSTKPLRHCYIHFDLRGAPPLNFPTLQSQPVHIVEIPAFPTKRLENLTGPADTRDGEENTPAPVVALRAKSLVFEALAACYPTWPSAPAADTEWARPALEYIEAHLHATLSNTELASLCHFSSDHFIVRFRGAFGVTPARYINERRLAVAAQKLLFSADTVEAIASQVGFCDRFHFSRAFKQRYGAAPATYRNTHLS